MAEMAQCLKNDMEVAFTIDGPRGPVYVAKPGAVTLAKHTGHAILPFHTAASKYIEVPSWDRLQIPVPYSSAICLIGEPIYVARDATSNEVADKQEKLQAGLNDLRTEGMVWQGKG